MTDQHTPLTEQQLDEIERAVPRLSEYVEQSDAVRVIAAGVPVLLAEVRRLRARVAELEATSVPDETEYAVRMPGSNDVWPRREFRSGHWERVLNEGGQLLERVIRRGPWVEAPNQCPGFEGNPVAPDLCAGCHEPRDTHEPAASAVSGAADSRPA